MTQRPPHRQAQAQQQSPRHWASINEASFVAGMRLLFAIHRRLGRWPFRLVLYPVLAWYMLTRPLARNASRDYLQKLHGFAAADEPGAAAALNTRAGLAGVTRHFASFAESILDKMLAWSGQIRLDRIDYIGQAPILADIAQGRGGLLICSHLGNLDLCRVLARRCPGLRLTVLVHTRHARAFNRMLAQLAPDSALNLVQVTDISPATAMQLAERVAQGEFIVIAGDRIPVSTIASGAPRVAFAPFLGQAAPFPVGPYILAMLLQCPVYLMFSLRTPHGAALHFERFREVIHLPRKERDARLAQLVADYAARLQHHCLQAPLQWFNFYPFWALPVADDKLPHHPAR